MNLRARRRSLPLRHHKSEEKGWIQCPLNLMHYRQSIDNQTWGCELDDLRKREKAATRELDAIAAQRRRLPMVELPAYTLIGADGPIRLADVFDGRSQLIVYHHMWSDSAKWQCGGCTGFTSQFTRQEFLDNSTRRPAQ